MAATLAHHPSGLPTIKCSDCNREIEISQIGDHVCSSEPPKAMERFNNAFSSMRSNEKAPIPFRSRPAPAGINTSIANRPFLQPGPGTPNGSKKSPFRMPPRSATSPMLRTRSPSPELPLAQECAFPVFPTGRPGTPSAPKRSQTENQVPSKRTESRSESRNEQKNWSRRTNSSHNSASRPTSPSSTVTSNYRPLTYASESTRKNSFSSIKSRPDFSSETPEIPPVPTFPEKRSDSPAGSISGLRLPFGSPREEEGLRDAPPPEPPTEPVESQPEISSLRRRPSQGAPHFRRPSVSAATRPLHEIGSVRTHRPTASRGGSPNKLEVDTITPRSGSAQSERSDRRLFDAPPVPGMSTAQVEGYDIPRSQSAGGMRPERRPFDEMPPLPIQNNPSTFNVGSNPYHTPSESISSSDSARQTSSSRSSPPMSASSFMPARKQSDAGEARLLDNLTAPVPMPAPLQISVPPSSSVPMSAPIPGHSRQLPQAPPSGPVSAPPINNPQPFQQQQQPRRRPAKSFSRPNYVYQPENPPMQQPPESPMDPAMQNGRLPPLNTNDRFGPPGPPVQSPQSAPIYRRSPTIPDIPPSPGFLPVQRPPTGPSPTRRATTGTKGNCRGCGDLIKGKSVSSADGRLTGRWHKHCFVCKTCREPFQTMDFYVLGNFPYCSRHYHELNRSMCTKCDRGIEGHYVETDRRLKFHPHCFTCQDCHLILRDNYFEDGAGKILCEQHAFRTNHLGPGRRFPEKRSTRLMMMM